MEDSFEDWLERSNSHIKVFLAIKKRELEQYPPDYRDATALIERAAQMQLLNKLEEWRPKLPETEVDIIRRTGTKAGEYFPRR